MFHNVVQYPYCVMLGMDFKLVHYLNLGVKTVPVVEHQVDESFFNYLAKK